MSQSNDSITMSQSLISPLLVRLNTRRSSPAIVFKHQVLEHPDALKDPAHMLNKFRPRAFLLETVAGFAIDGREVLLPSEVVNSVPLSVRQPDFPRWSIRQELLRLI